MYTKRLQFLFGLVLVALLLAGCGGQAAEPVAAIPTTAPPTETAIPPTETPVPPTVTPIPPTETPLTPTLTPVPTATTLVVAADPSGISPSPRIYITMAYDSESQRTILFGGGTAEGNSGGTWAFNTAANQWTQMEPVSGPTARGAAQLTYDTESDRVIMFGGLDNLNLSAKQNETWAYDYNSNTWTEMAANGPVEHIGPRLAYDSESDRVILFGGFYYRRYRYFNETLAYDFNTDLWTQMEPAISPPGRNYHAMAYDAESDRVLVWGGFDTDGIAPIDDSMWAYDFNSDTWEEFKPNGGPVPAGRDYANMAYDAESDRTILFGGVLAGASEGRDETWAYDYNANTWILMSPDIHPEPRTRHAMTYDDSADRVILFGGVSYFVDDQYLGDTWTYDLNSDTWAFIGP